MRITFDPVKHDKTLTDRGLDFADAAVIGTDHRIFSMRKANERERARIAPHLAV